MELHKRLSGIELFRPDLNKGPVPYFQKALAFTLSFYREEFERISSTRFESVTEGFFFQEYVWVVHASGFSAKAVGKFMPRLMEAYGDCQTLASSPFEEVFKRVKKVCNNRLKASSVHSGAGMLKKGKDLNGWDAFKSSDLSSPVLLQKLPHIGKVTCFHLARNVGLLEFVKPDLHLVRMALHWGFSDCVVMCEKIREECEEASDLPLGVIDLVLWYGASTFGTSSIK